ncbi:MAG: hypothetical protein QXR53_01520 [Candidatus Norongarragalinales archaeon]
MKGLLVVVFAALLATGCLSESPAPSSSATPTSVVVQEPSPLPSLLPSPTVVVEIPTPSPEPLNYSKEEVVSEYLKAVNAQDFEKAYSLVSRDFKGEDPDAATLAAFKARMEKDYPFGLSFSGVAVVVNNPREVAANIVKGGSTTSRTLGFILSFESGFWKLRVPFPTPGKYYNAKASVRLNPVEMSRNLELALNDFFSRLDSRVKNDPFTISEYDKGNHVFYSSKTVRLKRTDGLQRDMEIEVTFGPSFLIGGLATTAKLLEDRLLYFQYQDGIKRQGGHAGFYCYASSVNYFLKVKMDSNFAEFYSYEENIFAPVMNELNKICPP